MPDWPPNSSNGSKLSKPESARYEPSPKHLAYWGRRRISKSKGELPEEEIQRLLPEFIEKIRATLVGIFYEDGTYVHHTPLARAIGLVSSGLAKIIWQMPVALQLTIPSHKYHRLRSRFGGAGAKRIIPYGHVAFQSPSGEPMFESGFAKALWYMGNNLVDLVDGPIPTVRLKFEPRGKGWATHITKEVCCVVCGSNNNLTRHHVVPNSYRRFMPKKLKGVSHHDVMLVCHQCHQEYEIKAKPLREEIARMFGIPIHDYNDHYIYYPELQRVKSAAGALYRHGSEIPEAKKKVLLAVVQKHYGREEITTKDLEDAHLIQSHVWDGVEYKSHGERIVECLKTEKEFQDFVELWRHHFLGSMQPKHMPPHWNPKRPVFRRTEDFLKLNGVGDGSP